MPVSTLAAQIKLSQTETKTAVDAITDIHSQVTGAAPEFVNIVFMYGHKPGAGKLGVTANVRSGGNRNRELTAAL